MFLIVVLLLLAGYYFYNSKDDVIGTKLETGDSKSKLLFPSLESTFNFKTVNGKDFKIKTTDKKMEIEGLRDKLIFLKIFGWDCKYCQKEIPELIKLKKQFDGAFDIIAIESQEHSTQENLKFSDEQNINYHIVTGSKYKRFFEYLKQEYKWNGVIPLTIVIDATGKILAFEVGYKSYSLTTLLQTTLKQLTSVALSKKEGEDKK